MTAIKSTGVAERVGESVLLAFGVHLETTVQDLAEHMGSVGNFPRLLLSDTLPISIRGAD